MVVVHEVGVYHKGRMVAAVEVLEAGVCHKGMTAAGPDAEVIHKGAPVEAREAGVYHKGRMVELAVHEAEVCRKEKTAAYTAYRESQGLSGQPNE